MGDELLRGQTSKHPELPVAGRLQVCSPKVGSVSAVPGTQRIRPPWWLKPMNKVFIEVSRFGGAGAMVLTVAGRRSGQPRSTPVTAMAVAGGEYIVGGFPGAGWIANVRAAGGGATLARGRRRERVRVRELSPDEARPLLREWPIQVPTGVGFLKRAGLVADGRPEEFEALAGICPVFRLEPIGVGQI